MNAAQAFVGIGANLGDRWTTVLRAIDLLQRAPGVAGVECSPVFESDPVGVLDQPLFLNLVVGLETTLSPEELLARLQQIEQELGRERKRRWGPRMIDLDLLLYAGESRSGPELELPHPRMFERAFVVEPLLSLLRRPRFRNEIWAGMLHRLTALPPGTGLRPWPPA